MSQNAGFRERQPELDIIRIIAFVGCVGLHCLWYIGFYEELPGTRSYILALYIRTALNVAVPLFMVLTGYLLCEKNVPSHPFKGLGKTLLIYLLTCIPSYFFRRIENESYYLSLPGLGWKILDYSLNHYGWYIGMYIGLYLLAPYLNLIHRGLNLKENRRLLFLLFALISLPTLTNSMNLFNREFWHHPSRNYGGFNLLLPEFWEDLPYPLLYYGMGAYLRRYPPKIRARWLLCLLICGNGLFSLYNLWRLDGKSFYVRQWNSLYGFQAAVLTPLAFCLIKQLFAGWIRGEKAVRILSRISSLVLAAMLLSFSSDVILYEVLHVTDRISTFREAVLLSPLLTLASASLAMLMAIPVLWLVQRIMGAFSRSRLLQG